ncbi:MAG: hypothetical protein F6K63_34710 [Moorea sp. SIO1G6]|uniref:hypothetical protein n=1 Tax=Moorena sp. SIO1G6 TaxID=2607840 RepID=UPI0013C03B50|nr:hypothetical protein [Moorena sp. SIO1G6]NET69269.1 hypothetical protein [Moorena sp. SIO1G6]
MATYSSVKMLQQTRLIVGVTQEGQLYKFGANHSAYALWARYLRCHQLSAISQYATDGAT